MVVMREVCGELRKLSLEIDRLTRRALVSGFALQFSGLYQNFCEINGQSERRTLHDRLVAHIIGSEHTRRQNFIGDCDLLVFDTNVEKGLVETEGAFEAALFAYYSCVDVDYSSEAIDEFIEFISGLNASKSISRKEMESCFDYGELIVCEDVMGIVKWHVEFLRGALSRDDYIGGLRYNILSAETF